MNHFIKMDSKSMFFTRNDIFGGYKVKYRKVGRSGLKVSEISLGSWLTYGGTVESEIAKKCMATAIEHGINFIDSAEIYARGEAEKPRLRQWRGPEEGEGRHRSRRRRRLPHRSCPWPGSSRW